MKNRQELSENDLQNFLKKETIIKDIYKLSKTDSKDDCIAKLFNFARKVYFII